MLKILGLIFIFIYVIWPLLKMVFKGYIITQVHRQQSENEYRNKAAQKRKEGEIHVDYVPHSKKKNKDDRDDTNDYIFYEELND